jgi:hypothetical protein
MMVKPAALPACLACLVCVGIASAFNTIHQSSYNLEPRGNFPNGTTLSIAGVIDSRATDIWEVPASIALRASPQVELGAGLQTVWGGVDDHVPYMVFGVKWLTRTQTSFQADLLVPANVDHGKGFSLASHHRFHHFRILDSRLALRAGFMEALVDNDALMAFEGGWYPTLMPGGPLSLELGLIGSSQTKRFEENLSMDVQPALIVNFRRASALEAAVAMGLAGDHKEEMRVKVLLTHGF